MLEQETEQIIQLLIRKTIGQNGEVRLQEVLSSPIPRGIKAYLRAEVTAWLADELRQGRRMGGIVKADSASGGTAGALLHSAALEYVFPRAEYVTTLDQAVHFLGNYLCRPRWTLRQFLTPGDGGVQVSTVRQKLAYVADYAYLPALIERYLDSRKITAISQAQLGALIEQIDRLVLQRGSFADLGRMAEPLFEFFALASPEQGGIPLKPVLVFLGDKNQQMLQDRLEQEARSRALSTITLNELIRTLSGQDDDARIQTTLYAPSPEETRELEPPPDAASEAEPPREGEPAPPAPAPEPTPAAGILRDGRNVPLSLTFAGMGSPEPSVAPLSRFIKEEQRTFFIDALFGKDSASYDAAIEAMNRIPAWTEAAGYMRELFESKGIDPLSDEALEFVEAVQLRYRSVRS